MHATSTERLLTPAFLLAFAASFLTGLAFHGFLHLPGYIQQLGANEVEIGVAIAAMNLMAILARPAVGRLMDTRGRRVVVIGGSALTLVSCLLYLTVDTYGPWLFAVRLIHGLAGAAMFSVLFTIAADLSPAPRMTEGIALFGVSGMLPMAAGGLVGDFVLTHGTYRHLFLVTAGLAGLALVAVLPIRESRAPLGAGEAPSRGFVAAALQRELLPVWIAGFGFAVAIASYFTFLKTWVVETGVGSVGLFFSAYSIAAVVLRVLFGWVPDRFGRKRILFPSLGCAAMGAVFMSQAGTPGAVAVAGVLCGIGHGYAFPIISALAVARARASERGATVSTFTALFDLGLLVGSPALGAVLRATSYETMFLTAAGAVVLSATLFAVLDRAVGLRNDPG